MSDVQDQNHPNEAYWATDPEDSKGTKWPWLQRGQSLRSPVSLPCWPQLASAFLEPPVPSPGEPLTYLAMLTSKDFYSSPTRYKTKL